MGFAMTKPTLLLSTAIGLTVAVAMGTTSFAAGQHAVTASVSKVQPSKVPGSKEKLKGSVVASGYYGSTAVSGPYLLDSESVNCGGTTTCTFEMSAMVQQC